MQPRVPDRRNLKRSLAAAKLALMRKISPVGFLVLAALTLWTTATFQMACSSPQKTACSVIKVANEACILIETPDGQRTPVSAQDLHRVVLEARARAAASASASAAPSAPPPAH